MAVRASTVCSMSKALQEMLSRKVADGSPCSGSVGPKGSHLHPCMGGESAKAPGKRLKAQRVALVACH